VLVTGGGGFIGSWLTEALFAAGAEVTVLLQHPGLPAGFDTLGLASRVNLVYGSVADQGVVARALDEYEVDTCFHLAAQALVTVASENPASTLETNAAGTWNVLEACRESHRIRAVVVASSDKVYGDQPALPYTEAMPLLARNVYDVSKASADMVARSYHHAFGLPVAITRCANVYGGGDMNFSRLFPGTIRSALRGERPVLRSDGTPVRDYLYIDDAVQAYLLLGGRAGEEGVAGEAFNFGTAEPVNALDVTRELTAACGRPDLEPDIQGTGRLALEIDAQFLDWSKARDVLGWAPAVRRADGIARTVAWYRDHLPLLEA